MAGLLRLQEKIRLKRAGLPVPKEERPETLEKTILPRIGRLEGRLKANPQDPIGRAQLESAMRLSVRVPVEGQDGARPAAAPATGGAE
jgi:hypothetical protein